MDIEVERVLVAVGKRMNAQDTTQSNRILPLAG
jgi:hypothetical protein